MSRDRTHLFATLRAYGWDQEGWFLPLAKALEGVTAVEAAWQPPGGGNTIWQTVNHVAYWNDRLLKQLTGAPLGPSVPTNDQSFGEPGNPSDQATWQETLDRLHSVAQAWSTYLANLTDEELAKPSVEENLLAWLMHDTYHTGQIALIRKMQGSFPATRG